MNRKFSFSLEHLEKEYRRRLDEISDEYYESIEPHKRKINECHEVVGSKLSALKKWHEEQIVRCLNEKVPRNAISIST